jgi:hypothetical protein
MPMSPRLLRPRASGLVATDPDARAYISAVQIADASSLEPAVQRAIDDFVKGCKADDIWSAIKASCILAGARTLSGALTPLVGAAPTNVNFVGGDYGRKTGLKGDGSTKHINTNRNNNADPQNSKHVALWVSEASTVFNFGRYFSAGDSTQGDSQLVTNQFALSPYVTVLNNSTGTQSIATATTGLLALNRSASASYVFRQDTAETTIARTSTTPRNENIALYVRPGDATLRYVNARVAFYSIGESLNLSQLQSRVSALITAIGAAIP